MTNKNLITLLTSIDEKIDRLLEDNIFDELTLDIPDNEEVTFDLGSTSQLPLFPSDMPRPALTYSGRYTAKEFCLFKDIDVDRRTLGVFASRAGHFKNIPEKHKSFINLPHPLKVWPLVIWEDAYADYKNSASTSEAQ